MKRFDTTMKRLAVSALIMVGAMAVYAAPTPVAALTYYYKNYFEAGKFNRAISYLEALDGMNALDMTSMNDLMECYYSTGDYDNSISTALRWLDNFEDLETPANNVKAYDVLANSYYFSSNYEKSYVYFGKLVNIRCEKEYQNVWNVFMLGMCDYGMSQFEDMKRYCMSAVLENCRRFDVTIADLWDGEVENDDLAMMFYHFSLALYQAKGCKAEAEAAMQLSAKCGGIEAKKFVKYYHVPCKPEKSKLFGMI